MPGCVGCITLGKRLAGMVEGWRVCKSNQRLKEAQGVHWLPLILSRCSVWLGASPCWRQFCSAVCFGPHFGPSGPRCNSEFVIACDRYV